MSETIDIAVVGANTPAGEALLERLAEAALPLGRVIPLVAGEADGTVPFGGRNLPLRSLEQFDFAGTPLVLFAGAPGLTAGFAGAAAAAGAVVLDLTGEWAADAAVPLLVSSSSTELPADRLAAPGAPALFAAVLLAPIAEAAGLARVDLTFLRAASALGSAGVEALAGETARLLNAMPLESPALFGRQLAFNLLPATGPLGRDGLCDEERATAAALERLFGLDADVLDLSILQAPVFYGDSLLVRVETREPLTAERLAELLSATAGVEAGSDGTPTPVTDAASGDAVVVGRIRSSAGGYRHSFWSVADADRVLVARNGVQLAEFLVKDYLLTNS